MTGRHRKFDLKQSNFIDWSLFKRSIISNWVLHEKLNEAWNSVKRDSLNRHCYHIDEMKISFGVSQRKIAFT